MFFRSPTANLQRGTDPTALRLFAPVWINIMSDKPTFETSWNCCGNSFSGVHAQRHLAHQFESLATCLSGSLPTGFHSECAFRVPALQIRALCQAHQVCLASSSCTAHRSTASGIWSLPPCLWSLVFVVRIFLTANPTRRRFLRRQRAKARFRWFLHQRGLVPLGTSQLQALYKQLANHHSRDPGLLHRVRRALLHSAMAMWIPWTCLCGRKNGKAAAYCASCGQPWDPTYLSQANQYETPNGPWPNPDGWNQPTGDQSPRRRTPSRHRPGHGKGQQAQHGRPSAHTNKGKGQKAGQGKNGKGKGNGNTGKSRIPPPPPPGGPPTEPVWTPPTTATPSTATSSQPTAPTKEQTQAEAALQSLMTVLRRNSEQLTPELQEAMQSITTQEQKNSGRQLHSAVTRWSKAQSNHLEAVRARAQLHAAWRSFVSEAISRWEQYATEFTQQDASLQSNIASTKEILDTSKQELTTLKTQITGAGGSTDESAPADTSMDADQQATRLETQSVQIQEGLTTMVSQLRGVRKRTEDVIDLEAEQPAQRQRTDADAAAKGGTKGEHGGGDFWLAGV